MKTSNLVFLLVVLIAGANFGCGGASSLVENISGLVGLSESGTVIAKVAQIRSSYAVVAADLLEVKRGDKLDLLEETDFEKIRWYRVRAHDEDKTEGWIEAQNIITSDTLDKSKKIAADDKDLPAQATGQLRAASNLRLSPDRKEDNLLFKLENGSTFEITDWAYVPKAQDAADTDDAYKSQQKQTKSGKNADVEAAKEAGEPEKLDEKYDIWYKVRLDPSVSPAPTGWLFGRQIELLVPGDIVFYQSNTRKFVTWQRLDNVEAADRFSSKDTAKPSKPGSWVVLSRSGAVKAIDGVEPDFDGIIIFDYDKYKEEHYTAYRSGEVWGVTPLKVEGSGDSRSFTLKIRNNTSGQMEDKRFVVFKDKNRLRLTPPEGMSNYEKSSKR
ncbi:MAG TPA: hypothetical protein VNI84_05845 [Pyrinomonadaceae bacterium]|nr:hypothetical protein [Pyrinomonadaceae bacterium]